MPTVPGSTSRTLLIGHLHPGDRPCAPTSATPSWRLRDCLPLNPGWMRAGHRIASFTAIGLHVDLPTVPAQGGRDQPVRSRPADHVTSAGFADPALARLFGPVGRSWMIAAGAFRLYSHNPGTRNMAFYRRFRAACRFSMPCRAASASQVSLSAGGSAHLAPVSRVGAARVIVAGCFPPVSIPE
jgi:hypothetical protein